MIVNTKPPAGRTDPHQGADHQDIRSRKRFRRESRQVLPGVALRRGHEYKTGLLRACPACQGERDGLIPKPLTFPSAHTNFAS